MSSNPVNELTYSPFPWRSKGSTMGFSITSSDNNRVATISHMDTQALADATLIAAAPELLSACESVLEMINRRFGEYNETINESRDLLQSAIAKARGE